MASLRKTILGLTRHHRQWETLGKEAAAGRSPMPVPSRLRAIERFGTNPGDLDLLAHVPLGLPAGAPLVVVLHGCTQAAAAYDYGSGWSELADAHGFALAFPQQRRANNQNLCFNWFDPGDSQRGYGEARSIAEMVDHLASAYALDRRRVYITGLSAGGAMTAVMLACYPELFAGGAVIAGLPVGTAHTVQEAFEGMFHPKERPARTRGAAVRDASMHEGPWPTVSIWHGTEDHTVKPSNASELVKQWTDVHGLRTDPDEAHDHGSHAVRRWRSPVGALLVEEVLVRGMAHGTPVDKAVDAPGRTPVPFMLDVGLSSTRVIARGWGLLGQAHAASARAASVPERIEPALDATLDDAPPPYPRSPGMNAKGGFDVGGVIDRALRQAGLLRH